MVIKLLILGAYTFIVFYASYRYINHIDIKNRQKVQEWEKEYLQEFDKLYEEQYFNALAFEEKAKQYEKIKEMKESERNKKLSELNIDQQFVIDYNSSLQNALERIENGENGGISG